MTDLARSDDKDGGESNDGTLQNQLTHAIALQCSSNQILWTVFGIFWAANAALLVALFATGAWPTPTIVLIVASVGGALSMVWFYIQDRAIKYLRFYDAVVHQLERTNQGLPIAVSLSKDAKSDLFQQHVGNGLSVRPVMQVSAAIAAVLWLLLVGATLVGATRDSSPPRSVTLTDDQLCEILVAANLHEFTGAWSRRYSFVVACASENASAPGSVTVTATLPNRETSPDSNERDETEAMLQRQLETILNGQRWGTSYSDRRVQFLP
ncbi:MAG: hypothetical protein ABI665_18640 [Vicinamibacterales bacterium]